MKIAKSVDSNKPNSTNLNNPKQVQAIAESMDKMAQQKVLKRSETPACTTIRSVFGSHRFEQFTYAPGSRFKESNSTATDQRENVVARTTVVILAPGVFANVLHRSSLRAIDEESGSDFRRFFCGRNRRADQRPVGTCGWTIR